MIDLDRKGKVRLKEYLRLLGFPKNYTAETNMLEMVEWAENWYAENGKPWIEKYDIDITFNSKHELYANGVFLDSPELNKRFKEVKVDKAVMLIASAGRELEEKAASFWKKGIPEKYYFLETYGSAVVEELITSNTRKICKVSGQFEYSVLDRYSPGFYGWDISGQHALLKIMKQSDPIIPLEKIAVLDSGMLWPKKSQISLIGLSKHKAKTNSNQLPCLTCFYEGCQFRKVPFSENVLSK